MRNFLGADKGPWTLLILIVIVAFFAQSVLVTLVLVTIIVGGTVLEEVIKGPPAWKIDPDLGMGRYTLSFILLVEFAIVRFVNLITPGHIGLVGEAVIIACLVFATSCASIVLVSPVAHEKQDYPQ